MQKIIVLVFLLSTTCLLSAQTVVTKNKSAVAPPSFIHPGMMQGRQTLDFMKQKVLAAEAPWKTAFDNLKKETPPDFVPVARAHISVGAYGANSQGGTEFSRSATMVYNNAVLWYITGKKAYAEKTVEILNAWSYKLWDFDDNNAKLNVGLFGPLYLNAAEIIRYSYPGWKQKDMEQFKRMVLTVFYPTVKDFFTEANGNWDASIINTLLCIGIYTDNREIFNRAIERYYRGIGNSGITKYIYPNGQIQETTRDWGHVQLGIGEFAKAAQVAYTQGVDLYSVAGNRLALGFEYTSKFMTGGEIPVYGVLSLRAKENFRDIYESIYYHYSMVKGIDMPYTEKAIQMTRPKSGIGLLTSLGKTTLSSSKKSALQSPGTIAAITSLVGAQDKAIAIAPAGSVVVAPGDSIQAAIDAKAGTGQWVVLAKGVHTITRALRIPSGTTLAGEGKESILFLSPRSGGRTIENAANDMQHVTIRDLLIEGAVTVVTNDDPNADRRNRSYMSAPGREGICFSAEQEGQMRDIHFENLTVQNCTRSGVAIKGTAGISILNCNFSDNGASVVPGAGFHHNLLITRSTDAKIMNSRFDSSPWGNGIDVSFCRNVELANNEAARNKLSGIRCAESNNLRLTGNFAEGNDEHGIFLDSLMNGNKQIEVQHNRLHNNGRKGIYTGKAASNKIINNTITENGLK